MNKIVMGGQWGDEGKGKIVDLLSKNSNVVARYQGGANAGHTVYKDGIKIVLHQIPSGILQKNCLCILGNGMVIDPIELAKEIKELQGLKMPISNIYISPNAHIVTPIHKGIDLKNEAQSSNKIGTTGKGIGPTYVDKYNRRGIRATDICNKDLLEKLYQKKLDNAILNRELEDSFDANHEQANIFFDCCDFISEYVKNVFPILHNPENKILVEGAQGTLLDIDHGTFPYVTSSNCSSGGISPGLGIPGNKLNEVIGIFKAYVTRVGSGPFPTELFDDDGNRLQSIGKEFGATTGRKRRCGWFDLVAGNYSAKVNGLTGIALTKLDILDDFETIKVCTHYKYNGELTTNMSNVLNCLDKVEPVYKEFSGWSGTVAGADSFDQLPKEAKIYIDDLSKELETPITIISVGPKRKQIILK